MRAAMTIGALLGMFADDWPTAPAPRAEPAAPRRKRSAIKTEAKAAARRRRQMQRATAAQKQEAEHGPR